MLTGRCQTSVMSDERLLPRSVLLSIWLEHLEVGAAQIEKAVHAVQGDDEPHEVLWPDGSSGSLGDLFGFWTASTRQVAAVLPVAGDLSGLAGPGRTNAAAVEAGEAVLLSTATQTVAAVPEVIRFGSHIEPGHLVTWKILPCHSWQTRFLGTIGSWLDAQRELAAALNDAIERLMILDVARWRDDLAVEVEALRGDAHLPDPLPRDLDGRRANLLATGWRIAEIADLGQTDDGGSVSGWESDRRREALLRIESAARRAVCAATYQTPSLI